MDEKISSFNMSELKLKFFGKISFFALYINQIKGNYERNNTVLHFQRMDEI